jgi:hypothetical protein
MLIRHQARARKNDARIIFSVLMEWMIRASEQKYYKFNQLA